MAVMIAAKIMHSHRELVTYFLSCLKSPAPYDCATSEETSDYSSVSRVVELLKKKSEKQRDAKSQNELYRLAVCQILR